MSKEEALEHYDLFPEEVYGEPDCGDCPECGEGRLLPNGSENYGADRDGNRGRMLYYYHCDNCEYEEEQFGA